VQNNIKILQHKNTTNIQVMLVGKHTYGAENVATHFNFDGQNLIIGNFCSIAYNVNVWLGGNHNTNWATTYPFGHVNQNIFNSFDGKGHPKLNGGVVIGNDVWVGANSTIMSGVTIGDGAVIANNSHVVKNVEPYSIVGGNPAKLIRYRFTSEQIEELLKIKWWFWDDDKINAHIHLLCNENIDEFIKVALHQNN